DIAIVNGGGIRVDIPMGDITLNDILKVHPFGNAMCVVEVTGQQVLDALEWNSRAVPGESGGFLQVSGITYEIHTYIPSSVTQDDNGMFTGVSGEYRVKNVKVNGEDLQLDRIYTLASHNYMLLNDGDGNTMFSGAKLLVENSMLDNQVLLNYITGTLGGVIPADYADPHGQGRIVAVEAPAE
ncbi:MAG: 5'-nucleotidase C-terminal domain-containing protein, partial [Clostridia bacterium]|nr:5'-nucleotidase C-terminal domain-containing protein [Clostridia bacterium]